jgi:hypothetical protein
MPAMAAGQGGDDEEGVEPGLEVDHDQEVDEQDGEGEAGEQADVGLGHGFALAAEDDLGAARELPFLCAAMMASMARVTEPRSAPSTLA